MEPNKTPTVANRSPITSIWTPTKPRRKNNLKLHILIFFLLLFLLLWRLFRFCGSLITIFLMEQPPLQRNLSLIFSGEQHTTLIVTLFAFSSYS
ncbi:hypothetical protein SLA2020_000110 [Shorea laevis]